MVHIENHDGGMPVCDIVGKGAPILKVGKQLLPAVTELICLRRAHNSPYD